MNKFFKLFVAIFAMATLSLSFVSCGDDDEPTPDQPEEEVSYTGCVEVTNVKKGMNYSASVSFKLDKSKIEAIDSNKNLTLYDVDVLPYIKDSKGNPYLLNYEIHLGNAQDTAGKILENFDGLYDYFAKPVSISGTIK